jgi:hypothetical protein
MYCIDTSSLITAWRFVYPPDIFPAIWTQLDELIKQHKLISAKEVLLELKIGADAIYDWANARDYMFLESDETVQRVVTDIINKYPTFIPDYSPHGIFADPYVIAISSVKKLILVTNEKASGAGAKKPKIPNICRDLNIECIDFLSLIRREGWIFG